MSVRAAAIWSMGAQYVAFTIQFLTSVAISRFFLSPSDMGLYSIALSAAMMVSILQDFGISRYITGQPVVGEQEIQTCFSVSLLFALAIGLCIFALSWPLSRFYDDARLAPLMTIVALSYLLVPFGIVPAAVLQRRMDFRSLFTVNVGAAIANAAVSLGLAAAGYAAFSLAWSAVAQQGTRALIGLWSSGMRIPFPLRLRGARPILRFGSASSLLFVSGAIGTRSPELVIGRMLTLTAVGLFGRASSLAMQLQTLASGAVDSVFYSAFARLRDERQSLAAPYLRVVAAYGAVTWPAMAFLGAAATPIVLLLYGPRWEGVAPLLLWIALSQVFISALPMHVELPILMNRMRRLLVLNLLDTAASIATLVVGLTVSLEGAGVSRIAYGALWFLIYARILRQLAGFRWRDLMLIYLQSGLATVAAVTPLLLVYRFAIPPADMRLLPLIACAAAGGIAWLAAIHIVRHPVRVELHAIVHPLIARTGLIRRLRGRRDAAIMPPAAGDLPM